MKPQTKERWVEDMTRAGEVETGGEGVGWHNGYGGNRWVGSVRDGASRSELGRDTGGPGGRVSEGGEVGQGMPAEWLSRGTCRGQWICRIMQVKAEWAVRDFVSK